MFVLLLFQLLWLKSSVLKFQPFIMLLLKILLRMNNIRMVYGDGSSMLLLAIGVGIYNLSFILQFCNFFMPFTINFQHIYIRSFISNAFDILK